MTPFDKAKSSSSSKGLEIAVKNLSDVMCNDSMRMEAEFYTAKTSSFGSVTGDDAIVFSQYGTSEELNECGDGYPVLRLNEFDSAFIGAPAKWAKLTQEDIESLRLHKDDVLICRTNGNPHLVGKSALVPCDYEIAFASYLFRVRPDRRRINSSTLVAFLSSKYGRREIERFSVQSNQANFSPAKFRQIKIPLLGDEVNAKIEELTYAAHRHLERSKSLYSFAAKQLLFELGFANWRPVDGGVSTKVLSETIAAERIDAEYFQPKFDEIEARIRNRTADVLCAADALIEGLCKSDDGKEERYIELADIGASGTVENCTKAEFADLPSRARQRVSGGQVIVSSIEGSLKSCALITSEFDGALCSTGFHRFQTNKINPETLLLLFKSWPIQELLKRGCSGTILSGISADGLADIPLPILSRRIQLSLADKVRESFRLRNESKRLLEEAKKLVEDAIEDA